MIRTVRIHATCPNSFGDKGVVVAVETFSFNDSAKEWFKLSVSFLLLHLHEVQEGIIVRSRIY